MLVRSLLPFFVAATLLPGVCTPTYAQDAASDQGGVAPDEAAPPARKSRRRRAAAPASDEAVSAYAGRYAVMRDKRDTGCMLTLDKSRIKGGDRAQLAPGCRDQGIVIFDPSTWQIVKGELVLTARAGHKAKLLNDGEGAWKKDPKDGKPLGLKKL